MPYTKDPPRARSPESTGHGYETLGDPLEMPEWYESKAFRPGKKPWKPRRIRAEVPKMGPAVMRYGGGTGLEWVKKTHSREKSLKNLGKNSGETPQKDPKVSSTKSLKNLSKWEFQRSEPWNFEQEALRNRRYRGKDFSAHRDFCLWGSRTSLIKGEIIVRIST